MTLIPMVLVPFLVHVFAPFLFPVILIVLFPAVSGAEHDYETYEYEYTWGYEPAEFCFRVEVLYDEAAADQDEYEPGAAAEVMTESEEEAHGDEEDVPAEEPVGEWKPHLVQEEDAAYEE